MYLLHALPAKQLCNTCVCVYIIYTYVCTNVYTYVYEYAYAHAHIHVQSLSFLRLYCRINPHKSHVIRTYVCTLFRTVYAHMYIDVHTYTHIYTLDDLPLFLLQILSAKELWNIYIYMYIYITNSFVYT